MTKYGLTKRGEEVVLALKAICGATMMFLIYVELWLIFG